MIQRILDKGNKLKLGTLKMLTDEFEKKELMKRDLVETKTENLNNLATDLMRNCREEYIHKVKDTKTGEEKEKKYTKVDMIGFRKKYIYNSLKTNIKTTMEEARIEKESKELREVIHEINGGK